CRRAGIPEDLVYRPKWRIALELHQEAQTNGIRLAWFTADEFYGRPRGISFGTLTARPTIRAGSAA
ncbi:MAG: hypothetical protein HKL95_01490, partial [Phycisphaerae bacterium]|nr:hypothetical protein [Phycisphaerae bacterium]